MISLVALEVGWVADSASCAARIEDGGDDSVGWGRRYMLCMIRISSFARSGFSRDFKCDVCSLYPHPHNLRSDVKEVNKPHAQPLTLTTETIY